MHIDNNYIEAVLQKAENSTRAMQEATVIKAQSGTTLNCEDIAVLLKIKDTDLLDNMYRLAGEIKDRIYGKRVVMFAPLYISNYCVNNCVYCGFKSCNKIQRRRLTRQEIQDEVRILEKMGHKRLALEVGEDPKNCGIDYILDSLDAIYEAKLDNGSIRRVNVNIAATTHDDYRRLRDKGIGTYILFQETYHKPTYEAMHISGPKSDYDYHLNAFDRAMDAGIEDVGAGVLFGLYNSEYEVLALMLHNKHLENKYKVGFHTISMPRLKKANGMELDSFPHMVDDATFKRLVAIIRIALPYTGIIMSTRESAAMRGELLKYGVSQLSAGSCTDIGGYKAKEQAESTMQFEVSDERSPMEIIYDLINDGYIPSYCTACYRQGRTGDRFMQLAKSGNIQNVCTPNALMTLAEYILDYGDNELVKKGLSFIQKNTEAIENPKIKAMLTDRLQRIKQGERDLYV